MSLLYMSQIGQKFQLTRLMRGVTDYADVNTPQLEISTHTPHARRDQNVVS